MYSRGLAASRPDSILTLRFKHDATLRIVSVSQSYRCCFADVLVYCMCASSFASPDLPSKHARLHRLAWNCERSLRRRDFAQLLIVRTSYGYTLDKASLLCANSLYTERAEPIAGVYSRRVLQYRRVPEPIFLAYSSLPCNLQLAPLLPHPL